MDCERVVYFNGRIVPESSAKVHFLDPGFLDGDAVFDRTRTFGGKIFKLEEHLDRLYRSLKYMRIDPRIDKGQMAELTMRVLGANLPLLAKNDDYWVTQRITRGVLQEDGSPHPTVIIDCMPIPFAARAKFYRDGLSVITPSVRRIPPECISPRVKMNNYVNLVLADLEVKSQNPEAQAILLDINGNLSEGDGCNFFIVKGQTVLTPREQYVLAGISRQTVMELAQELNLPAQEEDIDLYDAYTADEAFVTSTSFCICPVSSINGVTIGGGCIGPITDRLQKAYSGLVGIDIVDQYLSRLNQVHSAS